jgi:hypothetical protein
VILSHGATASVFTPNSTTRPLEYPFYEKGGKNDIFSKLGFIGKVLNYELMTGTSPTTNGLGLQNQKTMRKKMYLKMQDPVNLHIWEKTRLNNIEDMADLALMG